MLTQNQPPPIQTESDPDLDFELKKLQFLENEVHKRHKIEWYRHKSGQREESLLNERKVLRLEILEVKRMYLESVKENDFLRVKIGELESNKRRSKKSFHQSDARKSKISNR